MGPYRSRLVPSLDLEPFWAYVSRRRRRGRWVGALLTASALAAVASFAAAIVQAQVDEEPLVAHQVFVWGLELSDAGVSPLAGGVPRRAAPTTDRSIDFARVQAAVERALPVLERCHRDHRTRARAITDRWLFVEVLLLGRQVPQVHVRANEAAERTGLSSCVAAAFQTAVDFPEPADRAALVTYPIRLP